jgi:transposase, IS30 family
VGRSLRLIARRLGKRGPSGQAFVLQTRGVQRQPPRSPEQIAGWLPLAYPGDAVMGVSHETIDRSLFIQSRGALRRELQRCLRSGRAMGSPQAKRLPQGRGQLRDTLHISQRPPEAADRAVPGHWER